MGIIKSLNSLLEFEVSIGQKKQAPKKKKKPQPDKVSKGKRATNTSNEIRVESKVPKFRWVISLTKDMHIREELKESDVVFFPEEFKKNYIVLDITDPSNPSEKKALILSASENNDGTRRLDNSLLGIRKKCTSKGYKTPKAMIASQQIIGVLYDKYTKKVSKGDDIEGKADLIKKFDDMLAESVEDGVSDMHFEITGEQARVKYRMNGILNLKDTWSKEYAHRLSTVIYTVLADEKDVTFDPSSQQAAIINREIYVEGEGKISVRVRLNTMPAYPDGYNVIMRILKMGKSGGTLTLEMLGYEHEQIEGIKESISKPVGCTIISGTTGSGKSTSLSVMLTRIVRENMDAAGESCTIKIITVEDPPEYQVDHVTQSPVVRSKAKEGENPFAESIRAAMRADPDILMVGEVRDEHSAKLLVGAVQSGHQAFTTVHAPSAIGIVSRLRSLGIPNDVLGNEEFIAGLIYQALVPVLCDCCKVSYSKYVDLVDSGEVVVADELSHTQLIKRIEAVTTEKERENIFFKKPVLAVKEKNKPCSKCNSTGITGRSVVAEVIVPDNYMKRCFFNTQEAEAKEYYLKNGGVLALDHGILKMLRGITDPRDVEKKLGRITNSNRKTNENAVEAKSLYDSELVKPHKKTLSVVDDE